MKEVSIQFRMVIKLESGISKVLALDDELVVATNKPAAMQCIRWVPDKSGSQHSTELLKSMSWMATAVAVTDMVFDRPMNISTWITSDGKAYAVQRSKSRKGSDGTPAKRSFQGYAFHIPDSDGLRAVKAAINARFSIIAVGCVNGQIHVYNAKDYMGNIPLSHIIVPPASGANHGNLSMLTYSPDMSEAGPRGVYTANLVRAASQLTERYLKAIKRLGCLGYKMAFGLGVAAN